MKGLTIFSEFLEETPGLDRSLISFSWSMILLRRFSCSFNKVLTTPSSCRIEGPV